MSSSGRKTSEQAQKPQRKAADLIRQLDARLRHINETILPSAPYLLQVPSTYRLGEQQINDWRRGSPFDPHEERLQYMTFLPHHNEETMFHAVGGWDDGKGNFKAKQDKRSGTSSPLPGQPAKKKISLLDYKKKAAGQPVAEAPAPSTKDEAAPSQKTDGSLSSTDLQKLAKSENEKAPSQGVKRNIDPMASSSETKPEVAQPEAAPPGSPPTKKARTSPNATLALPENGSMEKPPVFTLPPLLSPTSFNVAKPPVFTLPELLSPTLPPNIEEQLTMLEETKVARHKQNLSDGASQTDYKPFKADGRTDGPKPTKPSSKAAPVLSKESNKEELKPVPNAPRKEHKVHTDNGIAPFKPLANGDGANTRKEPSVVSAAALSSSKSERQRLIVILKIPKAIRKTCGRILGMTPRPQKSADQRAVKPPSAEKSSKEPSVTSHVNGTAKIEDGRGKTSPLPDRRTKQLDDNVPAPRTVDKKRRMEEDVASLEPSSKRQKPPETLNLSTKPHTPIRPPIVSPVVSQHSSASKPHLSTPKRDLKSSAMRRIGSSEGDVKTPLGAARGNTPIATSAPDRINREGRSASSASSNNLDPVGGDRIATMKAEQSKFASLGRSLKHSVQKLLPTESDFKEDTAATRQGAAIALEALLSFLLSFVISDELKRSYGTVPDAFGWRSSLGFFSYVKQVTQLFSPLRGLVYQLEGICRDTITLCDAQRLERDAFLSSVLDDNRPSTANSNPALSPSAVEKGKARTEFAKFRGEHVDNLRAAQQNWQVGYSKLPVRDLQRLFPDAWAKAAAVPGLGKGKDEVIPGKYMDGPFYLPLGPASSGIEAIRAGWLILEEWCNKEGVKWENKLGM